MPSKSHSADVIILGAGLTGLVAAYRLVQEGINVIVLDGRNRVGGRINTGRISNDPPLTVELGAEWIGETHVHMKALARELGINLLPHQFPFESMIMNESKLLKLDPVVHRMSSAIRKISSDSLYALDKRSWYETLKTHLTLEDTEIAAFLDGIDLANDIRELSAARGLLEHLRGGKNDHMDFIVEGGNSQIPERLAAHIGWENIHLKTEVKSIDHSKHIIIEDGEGNAWKGKKIICTVPTASIQQIMWSPALSTKKTGALKQLRYQDVTKIFFLFSERFWPSENFSIQSDGVMQAIYHATQGQPGKKGVLGVYATGKKEKSLNRMSSGEKFEELQRTLRPMLNIPEGCFEKIVQYSWGRDKYTRGSFAVYGPGQWLSLRRTLKQSLGNIVFAGEHSASFQGFMEGAVEEGIRASREVLSALKNS